ncbi:glycosyltransferase family 9 protein [bacterium]|nr:glycosyltransferase family 9 protein [bacterium]
MTNILVIRFSSLGDIVLTLPVLDTIKKNLPESEITFLTKKEYIPLVSLFPRIERVIPFKGNEFFRCARTLAKERFDLIVDLHGSVRSRLISSLLSRRTLRYPKEHRKRVKLIREGGKSIHLEHTVIRYLKALSALGFPEENNVRIPTLDIPEEKKNKAKSRYNIPEKIPKVALLLGAKWQLKDWGESNFLSLCRKLVDRGLFVGIFNCQHPIESSDGVVTFNQLRLNELAVVISLFDIAVANDSGPGHLAAALGLDTITIFGPTHPVLGFAPIGRGENRIITRDLDCSPCSLHGEGKCKRGDRACMDIPVSVVLENITELWNSSADKIDTK